MSRKGWMILAAVVALTGAAAAFWFLWIRPIHEHFIWYGRVRAALEPLAGKRPADVPPGQWEFMVGWTLNLHANCGTEQRIDRNERQAFLDELERRLQGPVGVDTIDWIWDEYIRITKGGRHYDENWRPTRSPDLPHAQPGMWGLGVK